MILTALFLTLDKYSTWRVGVGVGGGGGGEGCANDLLSCPDYPP